MISTILSRLQASLMALVLMFVFVVQPASAAEENLVVNGGFENGSSNWKLFAGPSIEVQYGNAGQPYAGKKLVELDSTAVTGIYQDIPTEVGRTYKLTFAFSPRAGVQDNKLNVHWGDIPVVQLGKSGSSLSNTKWQVYTYDVIATSPTTRLSFDDLNEKSDSLGAYIDAISVVAKPVVCDAPFVLNPANNHCYGLTDVSTWLEAENVAQAAGGHLVSINDQAEQTWLLDTFGSQVTGGEIPSFWIGFTDIGSRNNYAWVNGDPVTFTNWNELWSEPNKYQNVGMARYGLEEHYADFCAQVGPLCPEVGVWNDRPSAATSDLYIAKYGPRVKGIIELP